MTPTMTIFITTSVQLEAGTAERTIASEEWLQKMKATL